MFLSTRFVYDVRSQTRRTAHRVAAHHVCAVRELARPFSRASYICTIYCARAKTERTPTAFSSAKITWNANLKYDIYQPHTALQHTEKSLSARVFWMYICIFMLWQKPWTRIRLLVVRHGWRHVFPDEHTAAERSIRRSSWCHDKPGTSLRSLTWAAPLRLLPSSSFCLGFACVCVCVFYIKEIFSVVPPAEHPLKLTTSKKGINHTF